MSMSKKSISEQNTVMRSLSRREVGALFCTSALTSLGLQPAKEPKLVLTVQSGDAATVHSPLRIVLPTDISRTIPLQRGQREYYLLTDSRARASCIGVLESHGFGVHLTLLLSPMAPRQTRRYKMRPLPQDGPPVMESTPTTVLQRNGTRLDILTRSDRMPAALFTRYTTQDGPNKPYFFPLLLQGKHLTRRWPMEEIPGESRDHPHHRGLWFTHSEVNGQDFWLEDSPNPPRTVHTGFEEVSGGPVYGSFQARTEWRTPDTKTIARDLRTVTIYPLPDGNRLLDFDIIVEPVGGPLVFGDNKDGVFGLRLHEALAPQPDKTAKVPATGTLVNSVGAKNSAAWGKKADWVDYFGPIDGKTEGTMGEQIMGVALFDHPDNLRHPQTWHARTYGLCTANPFGLHDFQQGPAEAGKHVVAEGENLRLRYRVFCHQGDTEAARVASQYKAYATPPAATITLDKS